MDNSIFNFCKEYEGKVKADKDIANLPSVKDGTIDLDRIKQSECLIHVSFHVHVDHYYPGSSIIGYQGGSRTIRLDDEDLEYLHNKYSKKLTEEMNKNVESVKEKYNA